MEVGMYGTIARMQTKPGALKALKEMESRKPKGLVATYVFRMDQNPEELWMAVVFESKQAYRANADSTEQNSEFLKLMENLIKEPEWHDGEVVLESLAR
jgi:quinol monooxygenase YgiN